MQLKAAIAPYIQMASKTYPAAKARFLAGLPDGHNFFVVTAVRDDAGKSEQIFISVATIKDQRITGRIASVISLVDGYAHGDPYSFHERELIDWLITQPDGTEEGNVVGKFIDEWQEKVPQR